MFLSLSQKMCYHLSLLTNVIHSVDNKSTIPKTGAMNNMKLTLRGVIFSALFAAILVLFSFFKISVP